MVATVIYRKQHEFNVDSNIDNNIDNRLWFYNLRLKSNKARLIPQTKISQEIRIIQDINVSELRLLGSDMYVNPNETIRAINVSPSNDSSSHVFVNESIQLKSLFSNIEVPGYTILDSPIIASKDSRRCSERIMDGTTNEEDDMEQTTSDNDNDNDSDITCDSQVCDTESNNLLKSYRYLPLSEEQKESIKGISDYNSNDDLLIY